MPGPAVRTVGLVRFHGGVPWSDESGGWCWRSWSAACSPVAAAAASGARTPTPTGRDRARSSGVDVDACAPLRRLRVAATLQSLLTFFSLVDRQEAILHRQRQDRHR